MEELMATVSGNGVEVVSSGDAASEKPGTGNVAATETEPVQVAETGTDTAAVILAIEQQNAVIQDGFLSVCILLGLIAGICFIKGFWAGKG